MAVTMPRERLIKEGLLKLIPRRKAQVTQLIDVEAAQQIVMEKIKVAYIFQEIVIRKERCHLYHHYLKS